MEINDWCKFFQELEADPNRKVQLTVRQFLQGRAHLHSCDNCFNRSERVLAKAPKSIFPDRSSN